MDVQSTKVWRDGESDILPMAKDIGEATKFGLDHDLTHATDAGSEQVGKALYDWRALAVMICGIVRNRLVGCIEIGNLVEDEVGQHAFGADGRGIIERPAVEGVRVASEDRALAGGGADFIFDAEEHGDVLIGMETVGDEERNDDDIWRGGEQMPIGDERGFLHIGSEHVGVGGAGLGDQIDLVADGLAGVRIQRGAVTRDDESGFGGIEHGGNLASAPEDQAGH